MFLCVLVGIVERDVVFGDRFFDVARGVAATTTTAARRCAAVAALLRCATAAASPTTATVFVPVEGVDTRDAELKPGALLPALAIFPLTLAKATFDNHRSSLAKALADPLGLFVPDRALDENRLLALLTVFGLVITGIRHTDAAIRPS